MSPPLIMGILNVTPDSFSDGGRFVDPVAALAHAETMLQEGADIIDVGGESTRPGADPVSIQEESDRVLPVIERLAGRCPVSIDTRKTEVADAALAAGATILNDVSGSLHDVAARHGAGWIAMHMKGEPATMQEAPEYRDVVAEVKDFLAARIERARAAGVDRVWIDPGIGFGKSQEHNLLLLRHLSELTALGAPVAIGTSRKRFLGALANEAETHDRLEGSVATATWAMTQGVALVRVHDVEATAQARSLLFDPIEEEVA